MEELQVSRLFIARSPSRDRGETKVASSPRNDAVDDMSSRRWSSHATPDPAVCVSHCCGMTCLSGPMAACATRTQACSPILARRASSPVRGNDFFHARRGAGDAPLAPLQAETENDYIPSLEAAFAV